MTVLHMPFDNDDTDDDEDDDLIFATKTSTNQKKPIPQWARSIFFLSASTSYWKIIFSFLFYRK